MFEVDAEYRVFMRTGEKLAKREGRLLASDGPMFVLDVEGVQTTFHMASVSYVERMDKAAEDARQKASADAWIGAMT